MPEYTVWLNNEQRNKLLAKFGESNTLYIEIRDEGVGGWSLQGHSDLCYGYFLDAANIMAVETHTVVLKTSFVGPYGEGE